MQRTRDLSSWASVLTLLVAGLAHAAVADNVPVGAAPAQLYTCAISLAPAPSTFALWDSLSSFVACCCIHAPGPDLCAPCVHCSSMHS